MKRQLKNGLLITFGSIAFVFGILGVFLPLVPTTPLLLLAAACYVRSSQKLYRWLIHNKWFGQYIENFPLRSRHPSKGKSIGNCPFVAHDRDDCRLCCPAPCCKNSTCPHGSGRHVVHSIFQNVKKLTKGCS